MPFQTGQTISGWGVFRSAPWRFVAIFPTKDEAETKAKELGQDYEVKYGENQAGTDNFVIAP